MKGIKVRIHPAGAAVLAAAFLFLDSHLVLASVLALVLHEAAHLLTMILCGIRECSVELTPFGGMADAKALELYPPWKQLLSALSGVACSACSAALCLLWAPRTMFWHSFFQCSFFLAMLNSLPAWPLDGARVLTALASWLGWEIGAKRLFAAAAQMLGAGLGLIGLYGVWHGVINPTLLIVGPYLCYASRAENVSEKVRRLEYMEMKLDHSPIVPVTLWAGTAESTKDQLGLLLGRMQNGRYHLLVQIDSTNGGIQKCWTEKEMLRHILKEGKN